MSRDSGKIKEPGARVPVPILPRIEQHQNDSTPRSFLERAKSFAVQYWPMMAVGIIGVICVGFYDDNNHELILPAKKNSVRERFNGLTDWRSYTWKEPKTWLTLLAAATGIKFLYSKICGPRSESPIRPKSKGTFTRAVAAILPGAVAWLSPWTIGFIVCFLVLLTAGLIYLYISSTATKSGNPHEKWDIENPEPRLPVPMQHPPNPNDRSRSGLSARRFSRSGMPRSRSRASVSPSCSGMSRSRSEMIRSRSGVSQNRSAVSRSRSARSEHRSAASENHSRVSKPAFGAFLDAKKRRQPKPDGWISKSGRVISRSGHLAVPSQCKSRHSGRSVSKSRSKSKTPSGMMSGSGRTMLLQKAQAKVCDWSVNLNVPGAEASRNHSKSRSRSKKSQNSEMSVGGKFLVPSRSFKENSVSASRKAGKK